MKITGLVSDFAQSYACGLINTFGWIVINAGSAVIPPQLITAVAIHFHPTYVPKKWHIFLEMLGNNAFILSYNLFVLPHAEWTHNVGCKTYLPPVNILTYLMM
jgi:choline transport protein